MTWNEFRIRTIAYQRMQEREVERQAFFTREIAYQVYRLQFLFSKKSPPSKERFWPIGKKESGLPDEVRAQFLQRFAEFKNSVNGDQ